MDCHCQPYSNCNRHNDDHRGVCRRFSFGDFLGSVVHLCKIAERGKLCPHPTPPRPSREDTPKTMIGRTNGLISCVPEVILLFPFLAVVEFWVRRDLWQILGKCQSLMHWTKACISDQPLLCEKGNSGSGCEEQLPRCNSDRAAPSRCNVFSLGASQDLFPCFSYDTTHTALQAHCFGSCVAMLFKIRVRSCSSSNFSCQKLWFPGLLFHSSCSRGSFF